MKNIFAYWYNTSDEGGLLSEFLEKEFDNQKVFKIVDKRQLALFSEESFTKQEEQLPFHDELTIEKIKLIPTGMKTLDNYNELLALAKDSKRSVEDFKKNYRTYKRMLI